MPIKLSFNETMKGPFALGAVDPDTGFEKGKKEKSHFGFKITIAVEDLDRFIAEPEHQAVVTGRIMGNLIPGEPALGPSTFNLMTRGPGRTRYMEYHLRFAAPGPDGVKHYRLEGIKYIEDDPFSADQLADLSTLFSRLFDESTGQVVAAGVVRFSYLDLPKMALSMHVEGTDHKLREKARFLRFFLSQELQVIASSFQDFEVGGRRRALARPKGELARQYDVVIVGSGYGGGVTAARLTAAAKAQGLAKSVCVLERGKEWRAGDYPDEPWEVPTELKTAERPLGLFDYHFGSDMDVLCGSGLGGTSLINANVMIKPEEWVFTRKEWPAGLPDLGRYYDRAADALHVTPTTIPPLKSAVFLEAAGKEGTATRAELAPIAVTFERTTRAAEGLTQEPCTQCGSCMTGCNYTAKNGVDMTYLPIAERQGAQIFTAVEVQSIERLDRHGPATGPYRVHCLDKEDDDRPFFIDCKQVVLAAGSLGSTGILKRSQRDRGLRVSAALGAQFSGNGDVLGFAYNNDNRCEPSKGPTITSVARYWSGDDPEEHFIIEEGAIATGVSVIVREALAAARTAGLGVDTDTGVVDKIKEAARVAADFVGLTGSGALANSMVFLGMGTEDTLGRLDIDESGKVVVDWKGVANERFARIIDQKMYDLTATMGGTYIKNPRSREFLGRNLITVHPLGGCPMGNDDSTGVVNVKGEVFHHEGGLYVADGSIMPCPLGVNPAFTITALSEWIAEQLVASWTAPT